MARIRTIKPEFWDSPGTASASLRIRLLYIAMWNWADDHGRGTANAAQLLSFAFPNDAELPSLVAEFPRVCTEVSDAFGVVWYEAAGRPFYAIPSWNEHQKNERKATSKYPPPPEGITPGQRPKWAGGTEMRGNSVQTRGGSVPGTGEQGNRGTGEISVETSQVCHQGADRVAPAQKCPRHIEDPNPPDCGGCASASREHKRWLADQRKREQAEANQKQSLAQLIRDCPECDDYGRDDDLNPCPLHPTLKETA